MVKHYFITGTDTHCGKTYVTCQLLQHLQGCDQNVMALKPIATDCKEYAGQLVSEDALQLVSYNVSQAIKINPWRFKPALSPHIAAQQTGVSISCEQLHAFCLNKAWEDFDQVFIEGAGGLMVLFNTGETWVDLLRCSPMSVIIVVGIRLGCINHALLTQLAMQRYSIRCEGWIANCVDPNMLALEENIATLKHKLSVPLLATVPFNGGLVSPIPFWK